MIGFLRSYEQLSVNAQESPFVIQERSLFDKYGNINQCKQLFLKLIKSNNVIERYLIGPSGYSKIELIQNAITDSTVIDNVKRHYNIDLVS